MFSIKEAIVFGWRTFRKHSGLVLAVVLTLFALQVASEIVNKTLEGGTLFVVSVVLGLAGIVLGCGATLISLRLAKGEHTAYRDIVPQAMVVWRYFLTSLVAGVLAFIPIFIGGFISFIILVASGSVTFSEGPWQGSVGAVVAAILIMLIAFGFAVYLGLRYSMARLAVLESNEVIGSIRKSTKLTRGMTGKLLLFVLALVAINIAGALALFVGLLVSIPVSMLAFAHVYTKLKHRG